MKRFFLFLVAVCLFSAAIHAPAAAQRSSNGSSFFIGGTGQLSYSGTFNFAFEPLFGYEFNDRWAAGTGIGFALSSSGGYNVIMGVVEPFVRFCVWHNNLVFIDLKATSAFGFDDDLLLCQIGIRPSLRFRLNEHCDVAADIGLFGAQYSIADDWQPAVGLGLVSAGLWFAYRF